MRQDIREEAAAELEVGFFVEFFICFHNTSRTVVSLEGFHVIEPVQVLLLLQILRVPQLRGVLVVGRGEEGGGRRDG